MFPRAVRVASIGGVELRIDPSWLLIVLVLVVTYRTAFDAPGRTGLAATALATATAVLFAASILVHELAHALEATHRGAEVDGITLFALGGATALRGGDTTARDEFAIAAVGPWSNVVIAAVAGLVSTGAGALDLAGVAHVAGIVGWLNLGLAAFNLVPGAPLDGGRVLRAALWAATGDRHRATVIAAWAGVVLALVLLASALWSALGGPGGVWAAVWTTAIAAYVLRASVAERQRGRLGGWLSRRRVEELAPRAARIGADASVVQARQLVDDEVDAVLVDDGGPIGFVTGEDLRGTDDDVVVSSLCRPLDELPRVRADAPGDALANLLHRDHPYLVIEGSATVAEPAPAGELRPTPDGTDAEPRAEAGTAVRVDAVWLSSLHAIDGRVQETLRAADA